MKRLIAALFVLACLTGCSVNQQFVDAVGEAWNVMGPEYVAYVEADPNLTEETKETRKRTAVILAELIEEAKDE